MRTQSYLLFLSTLYILRSTVQHRASTMFLHSSQSWARSSNLFHFTPACRISVFAKPSTVVFWPSSHSFLLWVPEEGLTAVNLYANGKRKKLHEVFQLSSSTAPNTSYLLQRKPVDDQPLTYPHQVR